PGAGRARWRLRAVPAAGGGARGQRGLEQAPARASQRVSPRLPAADAAMTAPAPLSVREGVALAPYTTLGVGGPAGWFVEATDEATLFQAGGMARAAGGAPRILGGRSTTSVAAQGGGARAARR